VQQLALPVEQPRVATSIIKAVAVDHAVLGQVLAVTRKPLEAVQ
jgi:hypothetical protein